MSPTMRTSSEPKKPSAAMDLPRDAFPVTVRAFRVDTGEEVWKEVITEPVVLDVPPLAQQLGVAVEMEVVYANGESFRGGPQ